LAVNNAGQTAFRALLSGGGVSPTNEEGVWSEGTGSLTLVARVGEHAPGMPVGINYAAFDAPLLNNSGRTAFHATLADNRTGIWSEGSGTLSLVAHSGSQAPGAPAGVHFSEFDSPVLNDAGQTAFFAILPGGSELAPHMGIWATDQSGVLRLIGRTGDLLEVAPGDVRTIRFIRFADDSGNSDGRPSGFNDRGQLAFWAQFTDNSQGIFVSNLVADLEHNVLSGDFNNDGTVNAADYTVFRDGFGSAYDVSHYIEWKRNFGASALIEATAGIDQVPEPYSLWLVVTGAMASIHIRRQI
jgi:hypothetical protein